MTTMNSVLPAISFTLKPECGRSVTRYDAALTGADQRLGLQPNPWRSQHN